MTSPSTLTGRIFEPYEPRGPALVPMTAYQEFVIRRFRIDRQHDTRTETGRMKALMWYLEGYGALRRPLRVPLSAEQVRWMLEAPTAYLSEYSLPRIVEAFWRRSLIHVDPFASTHGANEVAYWWSAQLAPQFGVEHVLVPDAMVRRLGKSEGSGRHPPTLFLQGFIDRHTDIPWCTDRAMDRLACYIRILCEPLGLHYALFFPKQTLLDLVALPSGGPDHPLLRISARDVTFIRERAEAALAYIDTHQRLRQGAEDVSAATLGETWSALSAKPAPPRPDTPPTRVQSEIHPRIGRPVRVIGPINSQSGLGQATRMSIQALEAAGIKPLLLEFDLDNPAPRVGFYHSDDDMVAPGAINLLHLNGESIPLAPAFLDPSLFDGAYNIGYFFWELPRPASCHALAMELLDEIWVSSDFNLHGYQAETSTPVQKVGMAVEALPPVTEPRAAVRARYGLPSDAFVFMATFDGFSFIQRKNPQCALRAFIKAFGDDPQAPVRLVLKTHNLGGTLGEPKARALADEIQELVTADPRIIVIDRTLPYKELLAFKGACDAYVSLHRSEGWGFGALEAMQLGLPVLATNFSGNLEFCTPETAFLAPYKPLYLNPDDYIFVQAGDQWAEPDVAAAADLMREIVQNPEEARKRGQVGKALVEERFSLAAVGARYLARLEDVAAMTSTAGPAKT